MTALTFRDFQNARQSVARGPMAAPYAAPSEVFGARLRAGFRLGTMGEVISRFDAVDTVVDWYERQTGQPYESVAQEVQSEIAATIPAAAKGVRPRAVPGLRSAEVAEAVRQRYLRDAPLPARQNVPPPIGELEDDIAREAERVANELSERAGTLGEIAGLGGDLVSGAISLETLATIMITPVRVGAVGARALGIVAGREAAIGAAVEVPAQAVIQSRREDLGLDAGFWQGAMNVAVVGGLSGALGGLIRGVVEARNAFRAGRSTLGAAARREFDNLSPETRRDLESSGWDVRAVADVVTREFETNPRFRDRLRPAERESIERAIQLRNNYLPFQVRNQAELEQVERAITDLGASLEAGLPFRLDSLRPADVDQIRLAPRAAPETPRPFAETATPEEAAALSAAQAATPDPRATAPAAPDTAGLKFSKGTKEKFDNLLAETGRTPQDARAAIDIGEVSTGARGQITRQSLDDLRQAFNRMPRLAPEPPRTPPPRTMEDLQGANADLPPLDALSARLGEDEVQALKAQSDDAAADAAETTLRERAGAEGQEAPANAFARDAVVELDKFSRMLDAIEGCRNNG